MAVILNEFQDDFALIIFCFFRYKTRLNQQKQGCGDAIPTSRGMGVQPPKKSGGYGGVQPVCFNGEITCKYKHHSGT